MDALTRTGANAGIEQPVWNGVKAHPRPLEGLGYDWSPLATPTGDRFEWTMRLEEAKVEVGNARAYLDQLEGVKFPNVPKENPQSVIDALEGARKTVWPKRMDLGNPRNEVPNFLPDGTIHPDEVSTKLWNKPSVRTSLETVLYRLDREHLSGMNIEAVDSALVEAEQFTYDITYQTPDGAKDLPDVAAARARLDRIEERITYALQNKGADTLEAGGWARIGNRFQKLPVGQQRAAVAAAIVGTAAVTGAIGYAISRSMST